MRPRQLGHRRAKELRDVFRALPKVADEDLDSDIIEGLRSREPASDILDAKEAGLRGAQDAVLLELAARKSGSWSLTIGAR
ncbi:MAG: hypothetical protein LAQ69_51375 [Acidobacteriia bacterium]|nr:hypothetical protein [Terriglobia bacterium]